MGRGRAGAGRPGRPRSPAAAATVAELEKEEQRMVEDDKLLAVRMNDQSVDML